MNLWTRSLIVLGVAASAAVPALAAREPGPLSRYCGSRVAFVCGEWANYENCMRYRVDRLSERCQGEVKQLMAALEAQRRGTRAAPAEAPDARPAAGTSPAP